LDFLRLEIITRQERNSAISKIRDAVQGAGGWIISHQLYSNTIASINFELGYQDIDKFISLLLLSGLKPNVIHDCPRDKYGEVRAGIAITFIHNEPDLKRDVPPFG